MTPHEREIMDSLALFGWAVVDPWSARCVSGEWIIHDGGPICVVCGRAAPLSDEWPTGSTFCDPANHEADCAFAALLKEGE